MSPQQKRSTQYDWFKGSSVNGGKKTPKQHAKLAWKFIKIMMYLALFVFSATGCIQTLIIKTQTTVGKGVEFYSSKDEVAPHVTRLNMDRVKATAPAKDIYTVDKSEGNYWLNKDVQGAGSLANVHDAVALQNVKGNLQLSDAFKGSNEGLIIQDSDAADTGITVDAQGNLLVLSSLATKSAFTPFAPSDEGYFDGVTVYTHLDTDGIYRKHTMSATSLTSFVGDYTSRLAQVFDGALASDGTTLVHLKGVDFNDYAVTIAAARDLVTKTVWDADATKNTARITSYNNAINKINTDYVANFPKKNTDQNRARQAYSLAVLKKLFTQDVKDWMNTALTLPTGYTTLNKVMAADTSKITNAAEKAAVIEYQRQVIAKGVYFVNAMQMAGLAQNSYDIEDGFHFQAGNYPFNPGSTDWRPLVTWGDAWGEGPFYGIFAYPVAYISANMINSMPSMSGWEALISIFVIVFAIRILTFLLSFKATMQQTKMQELQSKKAVIDAKYSAYKGNKQMENRQKQEVSEMYKKEGVSMFGSISTIFLTMPFFLAIWRTIGGLPHIKSAVWLGINFSATSWRELFAGSFQYLPLMVLSAGFAAFQQILPRLLTKRRDKNRINVHQKAAMKKNNKTQNIMMLVFVFMALIFSAGLQVYWIAGGLWMSIQSTITHHLIIRQSKKRKRGKVKV